MPETNEILKQKLVTYLDELHQAAKTGGEFVVAQAPDVVREMVAYNLAHSVALAAIGVVVIAISGRLLYSVSRNYRDWEPRGDLRCVFYPIGGAVGLVCGLALAMVNGDILLKCLFAPKYFVLEQILNMVK